MRTQHVIGLVMIVAGGLGAYSQYTVNVAASTANPAATSALIKFDPANVLGISEGSSNFGPAMIFDLGLVAVGFWLLNR